MHEFCIGGKATHTASPPWEIYLVRRKREEQRRNLPLLDEDLD
jgi:hypothetical protein